MSVNSVVVLLCHEPKALHAHVYRFVSGMDFRMVLKMIYCVIFLYRLGTTVTIVSSFQLVRKQSVRNRFSEYFCPDVHQSGRTHLGKQCHHFRNKLAPRNWTLHH